MCSQTSFAHSFHALRWGSERATLMPCYANAQSSQMLSDCEVDHDSSDVYERRHERARGITRVETHLPKQKGSIEPTSVPHKQIDATDQAIDNRQRQADVGRKAYLGIGRETIDDGFEEVSWSASTWPPPGSVTSAVSFESWRESIAFRSAIPSGLIRHEGPYRGAALASIGSVWYSVLSSTTLRRREPANEADDPNVTPRTTPISNSCFNTCSHWPGPTWPKAIARVISVAACDPELPPVEMHSGTNRLRTSTAAIAVFEMGKCRKREKLGQEKYTITTSTVFAKS